MTPGIRTITRGKKEVRVLVWKGGTKSSENGEDLKAVASTLSIEQLREWAAICRKNTCWREMYILTAEIDRRDPHHKHGTLFEHVDDALLS